MRHFPIVAICLAITFVATNWSRDVGFVKPRTALAQGVSCPGDFNGDGKVNLADFLAFAGGFGARSGDANFNARLDMDGSGAVDLSDFLAFAGVFGTTCPTPASPPVSIPDAGLRAVIEDSLGKARGAEITRADMTTLTRLEAPNREISDLTGLEAASGLTVLRIHENSISDLSPLSGLVDLTELILSQNSITDVSSLSVLANLTHLNVSFNSISDVSPLTNLTNLTTLRLSGNSIRDISPLSSLINLTWLALGATLVSDVSALSSLTNLEQLDLLGNRTADVRISNISALSSLRNLRVLILSRHRDIADFSALLSLTRLEALYLDEMSIVDISWISSLTRLRSLSLSNNTITDVSPLSGLANIRWLVLHENRLSDLVPLSGLIFLSTLVLSNNSIADVSALSGLNRLRALRLANNRISDLAPLVANTGLGSTDEVDVRGNPLSATSINVHVPALEARGVSVSFDETVVFTEPRIYNDNVFVMPVTDNLAAGDLPLDDYAKRFYTYFSDAFDFLVFFPSLSWSQLDADAFKGAFYAGVGNNVQGIGKGVFFNNAWGSAGKLQGGLFFAFVSVRGWEHSRLVRGPMLHELMHRWANFIVEPAVPHWDFTSANGILGGFDIAKLVDHGDGRYSAPDVYTGGWARNLKPYSPIELYLAGLIPPEDVPGLWVAEDGELLRDASGRSDGENFTAGRVKTYTIEDIIAEHGPRVPDLTQSQRTFRAAVILLVSEDYPATRKVLEALSRDATLFSHAGQDQFHDWYNFYEATGGRAKIAMDGLSRFKRSGGSKRPAVRSFGTPQPPIVCHDH